MNQKQEIGEVIKNSQSIYSILNKLKKEELIMHKAAILMIGVNWDRYCKFQNNSKEELLELIKTLIARGASYDYRAKSIIELMIKLDKTDIENIEKFNEKYQNFSRSTLKHLCFKFFAERSENLDSDKYNIPFELKKEFSRNNQ